MHNWLMMLRQLHPPHHVACGTEQLITVAKRRVSQKLLGQSEYQAQLR